MSQIYGWDISTSIVGVCCINDDGSFVSKHHIDLRKTKDLNEKAIIVKKFIAGLEYQQGNKNFIEDRLSGFTPGRSSAGTLLRLAAFNAMVSFFIYERTGKVAHLHPSTVKAMLRREKLEIPKGADKKELTLEWARSRVSSWQVDLNKNDNVQPWCFDEADAYAMAVAGRLKNPS